MKVLRRVGRGVMLVTEARLAGTVTLAAVSNGRKPRIAGRTTRITGAINKLGAVAMVKVRPKAVGRTPAVMTGRILATVETEERLAAMLRTRKVVVKAAVRRISGRLKRITTVKAPRAPTVGTSR